MGLAASRSMCARLRKGVEFLVAEVPGTIENRDGSCGISDHACHQAAPGPSLPVIRAKHQRRESSSSSIQREDFRALFAVADHSLRRELGDRRAPRSETDGVRRS